MNIRRTELTKKKGVTHLKPDALLINVLYCSGRTISFLEVKQQSVWL